MFLSLSLCGCIGGRFLYFLYIDFSASLRPSVAAERQPWVEAAVLQPLGAAGALAPFEGFHCEFPVWFTQAEGCKGERRERKSDVFRGERERHVDARVPLRT